jgi:hypothetical protein
MAGHSKWANIQHRKGRQDEKRGKIWVKKLDFIKRNQINPKSQTNYSLEPIFFLATLLLFSIALFTALFTLDAPIGATSPKRNFLLPSTFSLNK